MMVEINGIQIENGVVKRYRGKSAHVVIPDHVKSIGASAFKGNRRVTDIEFPRSLTRICKEAFSECAALKRVIFAEGCRLSHIGPDSFYHCHALMDINIPSVPESREDAENILKLLSIPHPNLLYAFLNGGVQCNDVMQAELIRRCALKKNRTGLFLRSFAEENAKVSALLLSYLKKLPLDEIDLYIEKTEACAEIRTMLLRYKQEIYPPEELERIEELEMEKALGFREKTLSDYRKTFTVGRVANGYQISGYKKSDADVYIPGTIHGLPVKIAQTAFANHREIGTVIIENGLRSIESDAFSGCKGLEKIELPDTLTEIGGYAFARCDNLKGIRIPNGVKKIGIQAFARCRQLTDIFIPESVVHLGKYVFFHATNVTIHAPVGSCAHQYAIQYNLKFEPIP